MFGLVLARPSPNKLICLLAVFCIRYEVETKSNCFHQLKSVWHLGTNSISGVAAFLPRKYISFSDYQPIRSSVCSFLV